MTRTGGVSTAATSAQGAGGSQLSVHRSSETRGTKTARATRPARLGCRGSQRTPKRDGPGGRQPPDGTARPVNVEGMRAKPQERRLSRSVRRREGDGRRIDGAGDREPPPSRPALESGRPRRGTAPGERRDRRRTTPRRPQGAEDASGKSPPDRTARPTSHGHGQANTPERSERQYSPNVAQNAWRRGPTARAGRSAPSRPRFSEADGGRRLGTSSFLVL
jgi:hypothetical protein